MSAIPSPIPYASDTVPGIVSLLAQTFANNKTFTDNVDVGGDLHITGVLACDSGATFDNVTAGLFNSSAITGTVGLALITGAQIAFGTGQTIPLSYHVASATLYSPNAGFRVGSGAVVQFDGVGSGDTHCYLYRSAADTIKTPGAFSADGGVNASPFLYVKQTGSIAAIANNQGVQIANSGGSGIASDYAIACASAAGGQNLRFVAGNATFMEFIWATGKTDFPNGLTAAGPIISTGSAQFRGLTAGGSALDLSSGVAQLTVANGTAQVFCNQATSTVAITGILTAAGTVKLLKTSGTSLDLSANIGGSGSTIQLANGAGINFSVADANAYLYRSAANMLRTPGSFSTGVSVVAGAGFQSAFGAGVDGWGLQGENGQGVYWSGSGSQVRIVANGTNFNFSSASFATAGKVLTTAGLGVGNSATATIGVGAIAKKIEVFDASGASLGFIPVYSSIT